MRPTGGARWGSCLPAAGGGNREGASAAAVVGSEVKTIEYRFMRVKPPKARSTASRVKQIIKAN